MGQTIKVNEFKKIVKRIVNESIKEAIEDRQNTIEARLRESIKKQIHKIMDEGVVDTFTPYTPEEKARNFEYLRTGFGKSPEERNPSYAKALRDAEERRRQRQLQREKGGV